MLRLGISLGSRRDMSDEDLVGLVKKADALGYHSVWCGESWGRDAFTTLAMLACHTRNIKLAPGIAVMYSRTPALTAMSIASLDTISGGRAILGLGTSGPIVIEQWHGVRYERPLQRTREFVDILRMALGGERVNYDGEIFKVRRFLMSHRPVQERIPIYIAAMGSQNLRLTGEIADGWLPTLVDVEHLEDLLGHLQEGARRSGCSVADIVKAPSVMACVTPDVERARNLMRSHMAYYLGSMGTYYNEAAKRYGFAEEARGIAEAWGANDRKKAASLVSDEMLDRMTISGGPQECRRILQRYWDRGMDMPVIGFPHAATLEMLHSTVEALAPVGAPS